MMNEQQVLDLLQDPQTIRDRAHAILDLAKQNKLNHFTFIPEKMAATAAFVTEVIQEQYPNLDIPYHSRWRHFEMDNKDRLAKLHPFTIEEQGKILYELVIISVLLDAGAGPNWSYIEPDTNLKYARSEGLALASLHLYLNGGFSANPQQPLRVDAKRLREFTSQDLCKSFQVSPNNPLEGVTGRISLLNQLGKATEEKPIYFGKEGRLGNFYTYIVSEATNAHLQAKHLFQAVLAAFNNIWPARLTFHGITLGDVWQHQALKTKTLGSEYVPFHKLSQWLSYSLIEPLERTGIQVIDLEALTGLPEYRNGGLFIDMGVLRPKDPQILTKTYDPSSETIVEWRALTVALLDELAKLIRKNLQKNSAELPLAKILQGGTWEAGRRIAKQKRTYGIPPIQIISDGTVF